VQSAAAAQPPHAASSFVGIPPVHGVRFEAASERSRTRSNYGMKPSVNHKVPGPAAASGGLSRC
jgi:hypothetical protein